MNERRRRPVFLPVLALAALFVLASSTALPPIVASHFDASGHANGFMPRAAYVALMLVLVLLVPLALVLPLQRATSGSGDALNLPNRAYWLHPERRAATMGYLHRQARFFAGAVALFLACVHGLVVRANAQHPAGMSAGAMPVAMAVFLLVVAVWGGSLVRHFSARK